MYKLFLCLTFLHRKVMAYFAMLAVALCVMMLLIATSVMNGFLNQIEVAARGLFGDIVIDAPGQRGLRHYDAFIAEVTKLEEVKAATPFILTYGILMVPESRHSQPIQVVGIRLPQRAAVTDFAKGLFVQGGWAKPTFDPPIADIIARLNAAAETDARILLRESRRVDELRKELAGVSGRRRRVVASQIDAKTALLSDIERAEQRRDDALAILNRAAKHQKPMAALQDKLDALRAKGGSESEIDDVEMALQQVEAEAGILRPASRVILGLGLPALSRRTNGGQTIRVVGPGEKIVLTIFPLGKMLRTGTIPNRAPFTVIDDSKSGVLLFDSNTVYVPFEALQRLSEMDAEFSADDPTEVAIPARCGQIHIKLNEKFAKGRSLVAARDAIAKEWRDFCKTERYSDAGGLAVRVRTWRKQQEASVGPIESQRTLVVIMFGVMSLVSVVLIFVVFYTIVVQHTRDIGVIKSLGGSGTGVAAVFLGYGSIIGAIGAVLGVIGGTYFVYYINEIHDWVGDKFGFRVWSAESFMFDRIPNTVETGTTIMIVLGAVAGGLAGALLPAIRAARMQPVEALRYE